MPILILPGTIHPLLLSSFFPLPTPLSSRCFLSHEVGSSVFSPPNRHRWTADNKLRTTDEGCRRSEICDARRWRCGGEKGSKTWELEATEVVVAALMTDSNGGNTMELQFRRKRR
ncbi:unnamed protein product [Cuscuta epithymum]|uniref:Uncharacterized protein n=1 Tax=Cuscuta epithymum TaxID=186058 RepID=A0AAV0CYB8_9ASTE|nr:unnamed protein product [Cuscuta epithymum]